MNAPAVRIWTEQLLFRGAFSRPAAAGRPQTFTRTLSHFQPRAPRGSLQRSPLCILRNGRATVNPRFRTLRFKSDKPSHTPNPTPNLGSPEPALTLSQRLKRLSKQYGWLAVGVYFGLSALDFPFCYLAVRMLGTERMGHYEHVVVEGIKSLIRIPFPTLFQGSRDLEGPIAEEIREAAEREETLGHDGGKVVGHNGAAEASLWTQLALAYAVHKSLIFFRIPLTAAVLPKVAKTLRKWGWNVGKPKPT
ncbi:hypothetical protein DPSP01_008900 [Paraphaeosphaeria sporulosa]|uniref:DUF1279 domain-containing protein n=1 Tax=Paraphaeosphaeria sporulosa TaxID=1460663 RepID=A0A177CLJ9_9PLEO|nr:uncharacterized protein CC84DRAFT_1175449 [Paraphaeosphaeria sporulosa]OAG07699.1 hypothetical protein CC84DRAFT_1175449 [Paraphaeosphaeria sporulosa]